MSSHKNDAMKLMSQQFVSEIPLLNMEQKWNYFHVFIKVT